MGFAGIEQEHGVSGLLDFKTLLDDPIGLALGMVLRIHGDLPSRRKFENVDFFGVRLDIEQNVAPADTDDRLAGFDWSIAEQELDLEPMPYWEGAIKVSGTYKNKPVKGKGGKSK